MKIIAVIPARFAASRFPGKLLQKLGQHSVIATTYLSVQNTALFDEVIVAADDQRIIDDISKVGGNAVLTASTHESGSDRIAEVVGKMDVDVIINVQGDEPFTSPEALSLLIEVFRNDDQQKVDVATLMEKLDAAEVDNPNHVKVVFDHQHHALYFSRSRIPFPREANEKPDYFKHIGVYAYRKKALLDFVQFSPSRLEKIEKLEQLRYLENGYKIKMVETQVKSIGIDTLEDLELARKHLSKLEQ